MCPRFYALVCATDWLWGSCHVGFFWSVISQEENDSTESTQRQSCRSVWWSAPETLLAGCIKYTYGAVGLQSATRRPPHQSTRPQSFRLALVSGLTGPICLILVSIEILYAGRHLKQPIYRTLRTGLWWHYVYTSGPGWMSKSKLCVHTPITVVMGLGWNTL